MHHHYPMLPSTNTWAKQYLETAEPETWHLVTADQQTHGYGKRGRPWQADLGNLAMSLGGRHPNLAASTLNLVPLACGVAVAR